MSRRIQNKIGARIAAIMAAVLFAVLLFAPAAFAETPQKVRVGFYHTSNYQEVGEDGTYSGFSYDYYMQIQKYTRWEYEFVEASYAECMQMLISGDIDIMTGVVKTPERETQMDFCDYTVANSQNKLYARADNDAFCYESYDAFNGCTMAVTKGMLTDEINEYMDKNGFTAAIVTYDNAADMEKALLNGDVDLICSSSITNTANTKIVGRMMRQPLYYATSKSSPEVAKQLDYAMQKIIDNNPNFYTQMSEKYMISGANATATFMREELDYIESEPIVYVIANKSWQPIIWYNEETGGYDGIFVDVLSRLAEYSGLHFKLCTEEEFAQIAASDPDAENNVVAILADDNSWAVAQNVMMTNHVVDASVVTVAKTGTNLAKISDANRVIALPNRFYIGYAMRAELKNKNVIYCDTVQQCLDAVNTGKADVAYVNELTATYFCSMLEYNNIYAAANSGYYENLSFAVNKDSPAPLLTILDKSLLCLGTKDINEIVTQNSIADERFSLKGLYYSNPAFITGFAMVLLAAVAATVLVLLNSRARKKRAEDELFKETQTITARTEFFMMISHELRTPLNAVVGYLRLAAEQCGGNSPAAEYIKRSQNAARQMTDISEDMLDYARIASNTLTLREELVDIKEIVRHVDQNIALKSVQKQLNYSFAVSGIEHEYVIGDRLRLTQIMQNVLDNAVKFTPSGGSVTASVSERVIDNENVEITFTCSDTGKGMSLEFLCTICAPFSQSDNAYSRKHGGLGLGLFLTKYFVNSMQGKLDVQSEVDKGSTFTITLPLKRPHTQQLMQSNVDCSHIRAITGGESEAENTQITELLSRLKIKSDSFTEAKQVLRRVKGRQGSDFAYSLCVIDESLLKQSETLVPSLLALDTPPAIFVMTSNVQDTNKLLNGSAVQQVLYKPIFQSVLFDAVINTFGAYKPEDSAQKAPDFTGLHAMVAEDNALNADILTRVLAKAKVQVTVCENGRIAADAFAGAPPNTYNIIFMDIQMPVMNGYEATRAIRAAKGGQSVPIVAVSANAFPEDIEKSLASGMNAHLSKPVDTQKLYAAITKYCQSTKEAGTNDAE